MFQTEFCGPHYKLLISWDSENHQNYSFDDDILKDQGVFYKLNDLYQNLSKFSTEFVECMKSVHGPSNLEQLQNHLHENNPNVTFKIDNDKELNSEELFLLRQQVEKLKEEKEQLVIEHGNEISKLQNNFEEDTSKLVQEQEKKLNLVKQELENKYNEEMSDLRKYFENKCTESLRQFTEESYQCSRDSDSDSFSDIEPDDENYEAISSTKYPESNIDHATKDLQKILDKDLKNIRKAYIVEVDKLKEELTKKKEEEIRELKQALETKYVTRFESFQAQLDRLMNDQLLEDSVHYVHSQVKEEYENELEKLQNLSDIEFATRMEDELILKHDVELDKRDEEWRNHVESSLSDIVVESALKAVIKESQQKSQSCHCSPAKKLKFKEIKQMKQKHKQELDDVRFQYENEMKSLIFKYEKEIQKFNEESNTLINQNKELLETNEKHRKEIDSLKRKLRENLHLLQSSQENEIIDRIKDELSKMKTHYEIELSTLRESKCVLEKALDDLQEKMRNMENTRHNIISSLEMEFKELISKEQNGEVVVWPDELKTLYEIVRAGTSGKSQSEQLEVSVTTESNFLNDRTYEDDDLEEILKQRETLRKVILTLYSACEGFRRYITNLDEERNNTLTNELNKIGVVPSKDISTIHDIINGLSETEKDTLKKMHLSANISEMMSMFGDDDSLNITFDCNKSFNQSELSCWFEKLKNDAAAILCLTSGQKVEVNDDRLRDVDTQTEVDGRKYEETQQVMEVLQKEISAYEEQYARAQQDIDGLTLEVERLNNKINSLESLEAYGEGVNAVPERAQAFVDDTAIPQKHEFCVECDKVREEARKQKEDLESQIEAASKKLKSFEQFLEHETVERESERDEFDKKVQQLLDQLKEKERELCSLNNYATELNTLEQQLKELTKDYESTKIRNQTLETELNAATDKIWTLRERNQDLETKLAHKSVLAENARVELKKKEEQLEHLQHEYEGIRQELDSLQDNGTKQLDMLHEQHEISSAMIKQMKNQLLEVEKTVMSRTRELENNYVTINSSTVASSPSEDISVCDRIADRLRLVSPSGSDVSSSPVHLPVDLLVCLNEKLNKLFRAEDAALKRIQDQDMQINKLSLMIHELQLEKETLQDRLNEVSSKLGEAKMKVEHLQHRSSSAQSEVASKLTKTIESLESQIEAHMKTISQKDAKLKDSAKRIEQLENYIKNIEKELTDKIEKIELVNDNLQQELRESTNEINKLNDFLAGHRKDDNLSLSTVVEKLLVEKNEQIHELEERIDMLKSLAEFNNKSHSTEIDSKGSSRHKANFTETLESYSDFSDHTRHAVAFDESISPRYISISSSVKKPLLGSAGNESSCSLQPIQEIDEIGKQEEPVPKEVTFKDDSIQVNLDDLSWERAPNRESTKIDLDNVDGSSTVTERTADALHEEVKVLKKQLEEEKQNHFSTLIQLRELNSRWETEKRQMKDAEAAFTRDIEATEKRLKNLEWEHVSCKEQAYKYEQQVLILTKDLDMKKEAVEELKKQLNEMESLTSALREVEARSKMEAEQLKQKDQRLMELSTVLNAEKKKTQELNENYEKWMKAVVKERVDAQVKCQEFANSLNNVSKELENEKNTVEKLTRVVENMNQKTNEVNALTNQLKNGNDEITGLKETIKRLEIAIELAEGRVRQLEGEREALRSAKEQRDREKQTALQSGVISSHNSTLKDLTQKVQKEVDLATLLDENMLQSLEFDSKTESFLEELNKQSPVEEEMKQILLKVLYGGFEALNMQEKGVLQNAYYLFDDVMPNKVELLQETVERLSGLIKDLQIAVENEKRSNKELSEKNYKLQLEMNRLDTVHSYFEERISFLIAKLDEYRNKTVKTEIELTTEKTSRRQAEVMFEHYKRQVQEKQAYNSKKSEETLEQLNATTNENLKLRQESEVLRNKIESLIAELNSVKAITQYHSDSESELSRSLNPLKERLNEMEEKYVRIKHDFEKKKIELRTIKANLNVERNGCKKLESIVKEISTEKHKLEKQLIDKNSRIEDLNWQKQKLEDKLKAAELAEMKRRKMKTTNDATKKEFECSKELQRKLEKECQEFQKNITKLVDELASMKSNCKQVTQEAQRIFLRMLKAESSQRSLVYQKNYLVITLHEYEQKCDEIVRNITSGVKTLSSYVAKRISMKQKFRSLVFCVISMHRMQFLNNRRIQNNFVKMKHYFLTHVPEITARNDDCFDVQSVKKLHQREQRKDIQDVEEMALQNLCQQYAVLVDIFR